MIISTIKEIKDNENRVGLIPEGIRELKKFGHQILVQKGAGEGAGFSDHEYEDAGAELLNSAEEIIKKTDILVKVKEPLPSEYPLLEYLKDKTLFTYLHLSGVDPELTTKLIENNITAIGYETVEDEMGRLPLLAPMSEIAGIIAIQYAGEYLQRKHHGRGITLGKVHNTDQPKVVIVGAGVVGATAAKTSAAMGSQVKLFDINEKTLQKVEVDLKEYLGPHLSDNLEFIKQDPILFERALLEADALIGAVLVKGARAPRVVSEEQIKMMKKGAVIIDVAIDQGGCIWGSKATSHSHPTYEIDGKIYCCVPNMPGQVARQSTQALTNATLPYILAMANDGILKALCRSERFAQGLNTYKGKITYQSVAKDLKREEEYVDFLKAGYCENVQ